MGLEQQYNELFAKYDEINKTLTDFDASRKKLAVENSDLARQFDESENQYNQLATQKLSIENQLEDFRKLYDAETKQKAMILEKLRNYENDFFILRDQLEEAHGDKSDVLRMLSKANAEALMWRSKYESDAVVRAEELENQRLKLQARLENAEKQIEALNIKAMHLEKIKMRAATELADLQVGAEKCAVLVAANEKRARNFDKVIGEWKIKVDDLNSELESSQKECRNFSTELFRIKAMYEESLEHLDSSRKENKNLADEIKDLLDQLGDGGRSIHELDKQRRRLEVEKEELQSALEEAEAALEQEENKVLRAQLELGQVRQEIDRRIQEKEEEFDNTRKNHARAMESLGASLEGEQRAKGEALRIKKKLESDINELEIALDHANKANAEGQKAIKRYQGQLRDTIQGYEEQARGRQEVMEAVGIAERKAGALSGEVEESRALLDSADRGKRQIDAELADARNAVNEMQVINTKAMHDKRGLESVIHTLQAEIDDALQQAKNSEEKSKRAMVDAARLADELRAEQDHVQAESRAKRALDTQLGELEVRLSDAEATAAKGGKSAMAKLEMKIRELELELGSVQTRTADSYKAFQRAERRVKELQFQQDEDKKNQDRMSDLANKLQQKIKTYKTQIEEAEEIAALNLAKYRKAQQELEETEERGKLAGAALGQL